MRYATWMVAASLCGVVAGADRLLGNTNEIKTLTVEQAKTVASNAKSSPAGVVSLNGLTTLSAEVAAAWRNAAT